jgi:hypothetical protein
MRVLGLCTGLLASLLFAREASCQEQQYGVDVVSTIKLFGEYCRWYSVHSFILFVSMMSEMFLTLFDF